MVKLMIKSVLLADSDSKTADHAMTAIEREFIDLNELRAATPKDIIECIGRDYVYGREKSERIIRSLNMVFDKTCTMSLDYALKMGKRELAGHLMEIGLGHFASAYLLIEGFGEHAIPVDKSLMDALEIETIIPPETEPEKIRDLLEKMVPAKSEKSAHKALRTFVAKHEKEIQKLRDQRAEEQARTLLESHGRMRASEDISFPDEGFYDGDEEVTTTIPEEMMDDRSELLDSSSVQPQQPAAKTPAAATKNNKSAAKKAATNKPKPATKKTAAKPATHKSKSSAKPAAKSKNKKKR